MQLFKTRIDIGKCFDYSILIYLVAYIYYYDDTIAYSHIIRMIATLSVLFSGVLLLLMRRKIELNNYIVAYSSFFLFCIISSLWARNVSLAQSSFQIMLRIILFFFFIDCRIKSDYDTERILNVFVCAVLIVIGLVTVDMVRYFGPVLFLQTRFGIVGNNPNIIAMLSVFSLLICLHKIKTNDKIHRYIILGLFFFIIILLTQSKKGLLSLFLGIFLVGYFRNSGNKKLKKVIRFVIAIVFAYMMIMMIPSLYKTIGIRFEELISILEGNIKGTNSSIKRLELIQIGFDVWLQNPLLGTGINNFSTFQNIYSNTIYYSHCNYIELLSGVGIIGFILYYFYPIAISLRKIELEDDLRIVLKSICLIILIMDVAEVTFQTVYIIIFYCLFSIAEKNKGSYKTAKIQSLLNG